MESNYEEKFKTIQAANESILKYFNNIFLEKLEQIQEIKTNIFEVNVKIDELNKTRDLYVFKSSTKRSAFSPTSSDDTKGERNKIIEKEIAQLNEENEIYHQQLRNLEISLHSLKDRLGLLNDAKNAIEFLSADMEQNYKNRSDNYGFDFIDNNEAPQNYTNHGYNILMQQAFDDAYITTILDKEVKDSIIRVNNKLDNASRLLRTDVARAKITLNEIKNSSDSILKSIDVIETKMHHNIDANKPFMTLIDDFIMEQRENHPECIIEFDCDYISDDTALHSVFIINTLKLLNIFFDNIFKHSNATKVEFTIYLEDNNMLNINIKDNGIGITDNYLSESPWYSSLHKAHEITYLLNGHISIVGSLIGGTEIKVSYPVGQR